MNDELLRLLPAFIGIFLGVVAMVALGATIVGFVKDLDVPDNNDEEED